MLSRVVWKYSICQVLKRSCSIAQGDSHGYVIQNGVPYGWGLNSSGQLGFKNTSEYQIKPKPPVGNLNGIIDISVGVLHTTAIDQDGMLWCWGGNSFGQLGQDKVYPHNYFPQRIYVPKPMISVSATGMSNITLDNEGGVWVWGWNNGGKLGFNHDNDILVPTQHQDLPPMKQISSGAAHSILVDREGNAWVYGDNKYNQLGIDSKFRNIRIQKHPNLNSIVSAACGMGISIVLDDKGVVYQVGYTKQELLQLTADIPKREPFKKVSGLPKMTKISCGSFHCIGMDEEEKLWAWGSGDRGQLGLGDRQDHSTPQQIPLAGITTFACGGDASVFLSKDQSILYCGKQYFNSTGETDNLSPQNIFTFAKGNISE